MLTGLSLALALANTSAAQIDTERLVETVKVLASDAFEGRAPGGPGEAKTIDYLTSRFVALGLEPGGKDGRWTQAVPLNHTQIQGLPKLALRYGDREQSLVQSIDIEVSTVRPVEHLQIEAAPVVFVGFGVSAP